jgi:tetratricopeptide (TPR) repeat protein
MVEMTGLYQFLLQKLKLEGDKQTYKENAEDAIKLMTKHYAKNPDVLITYLTCCDICFEEKKYEEMMKFAKDCVEYTNKYFSKDSQERLNALMYYSRALVFNKKYEEAEKITRELADVAKEVYKSRLVTK